MSVTRAVPPPDSSLVTTDTANAIPSDRRRLLPALMVGAAALVAAGLLSSRLGYVPAWDGRFYTHCFFDAAARPFATGALRCGTHASQLIVLTFAVILRVLGEHYVGVLLINAAWLTLAAIGFHTLLARAFPDERHRLDRALLTSGFILQPSFLAAVVQTGLDLPLVGPLLWVVIFLLDRRWVAAILAGTFMAFTKETGVLLYGAAAACYAAWQFITASAGIRARVKSLLRLAPLGAPFIAFAADVAYRKATAPTAPAIWYGSTVKHSSLLYQFLVPRLDLHLIDYLDLMLVLNFAWIFTAFAGADAFVGMVRRGHRLERRPMVGADSHVVGYVLFLAFALAVILTRFVSYGFTRYVLAFIAVLPIVAYASMVRLGLSAPWRRVVLGAMALLLMWSSVRTIDPVSRWLWGTFDVGDRSMLRMTSVTGECCGAGQEQLTYSLEFTTIFSLVDDALAEIRPSPSTAIVVPDSAHWERRWRVLGELDRATGRRTLRRDSSAFRPSALTRGSMYRYAIVPDSAWFLAMPNGNVGAAMRDLSRAYVFGPERQVRRGSYSMSYYTMTLRRD